VRVLALVPDLLFGSKVQAMLAAAGHEVELVGDPAQARAKAAGAAVLVVDLTTNQFDGSALVAAMRRDGELGDARTLAFYSHVEHETRERAEAAGFDLVVPRSRMAREGGALISGLGARR
jgi:CheY-like chemotaxis protein